ncbi:MULTISPECIES: SGNH/GDSL hydrolase family protein [unclassified Streptococcus]|uniref:SGNH/GDSL hydrolase family protein n=1 Tax=unclassified Streptococcus TaxID=2608887 RepID=UPI0010723052|nr:MULTISPECIES: SGNH/GDSL hydrolase family protein [unclassified Streptococcus]MBF0786810.1 SGNH/GDSL hydrolase family protein [Streptococcus sp. 19428wC2_LYSM12]MCQ9211050.1 SGNH/GDSL hydrolase family protein [Streptococcus sp. B01]MCQ9214325.1 SGNH/GDSL hydrolase family protein [Streptococcus sp. O1]TFV06352.1 GDSL family lipase [Streptococcus sp. LYSM12]
MNSRTFLHHLLFFFLSLLGFHFFFQLLIPTAAPRLEQSKNGIGEAREFYYVALGDSLTQGVGDKTAQGGFVPLLAQGLGNQYDYQVTYDNYGVAGNTSQQILDRMDEPEIAESLVKADMLTLTVGGNDLRQTILDNITGLDISVFDDPAQKYSKRLRKIIDKARVNNPYLPIYVIGIYNPFYLNFPELTEMQIIVDKWNQVTATTVERIDGVYFVPINDLLYKGLDGEKGFNQSNSISSRVVNNLLAEEDSFHPNNTGYEIMNKAVMEAIHETKGYWKNQ